MTELEKLKAGLEYNFYNSVVGGNSCESNKEIENDL